VTIRVEGAQNPERVAILTREALLRAVTLPLQSGHAVTAERIARGF
jgi:hypothetical protein